MELSVSKEELYDLIKKAIREVIQEDFFIQYLKQIQYVDSSEMEEIINIHGEPSQSEPTYHKDSIHI